MIVCSSPRLFRRSHCHPRHGLSAVWVIVTLPVLLILFCIVLNVGNLWLARVELENAVESAALAAVKEWGDQGGGWTLVPRDVGVAFAYANRVRGQRLVIGTNYDSDADPEANPNQNLRCDATMGNGRCDVDPEGNLIFGALIEEDGTQRVIFNAGLRPGCNAGTVLVDATASGPGNLVQDNAWGIAFQRTDETPPGLRIRRVIINLRASGGQGLFDSRPVLSDSLPQPAVQDTEGNSQPDVVGFSDLTFDGYLQYGQIKFSNPIGQPTLTIDFDADPTPGGDRGFDPCDRIRFGVGTSGVSHGNGHDDGDGVGRDGVGVTILFTLNGHDLPPVTGFFIDNTEGRNDRRGPADIDPACGSLIVHPAGIPDLPRPATSSDDNNGQAYALLSGFGRPYAVRAQAVQRVPLFCCSLFGYVPTYCVRAKATAKYKCTTGRPELVRVDEFICPGP